MPKFLRAPESVGLVGLRHDKLNRLLQKGPRSWERRRPRLPVSRLTNNH